MNYADIKADDPATGDAVADLATLAAMTETTPLAEKLINERTVYAALGGAAGEAFLQGIGNFNPVPGDALEPYAPLVARIVSWLTPGPESGVDIGNVELQGVLSLLASAGVVEATSVTSLIALASETNLKYPGIRTGDLEKARAL